MEIRILEEEEEKLMEKWVKWPMEREMELIESERTMERRHWSHRIFRAAFGSSSSGQVYLSSKSVCGHVPAQKYTNS